MNSRRVALVTGGTRGIGLGIARRLAQEGFDLAVCGVRAAELARQPVAALRALGADVLYVACDVGEREQRERLLSGIRERFGRLHVVVNNAGVAPAERRDILDATEESFERVLAVNLRGPYFLTQAAARWMIEQKRHDRAFAGCIVNVSSVSATFASTNRGEYCVAKAGLAMATTLWAARLGEFDIPVYEVRPGVITTDMTADIPETRRDKQLDAIPLARFGTPEEVAGCVSFLASDAAGWITGQTLCVDGGLCMRA